MENNINNWVETAKNAYKAREQRKYWEEKEQELLGTLKELSGNVTTSHDQFMYKKIIQQGRINYASIPQLKDINLDIYRGKEIEMWKLEVILRD